MARIQGFDDDFVFLGSLNKQYADVVHSFPPLIAKRLADLIWGLVDQFTSLGGLMEGNGDVPRGQKRRRGDYEGL